MLHCDAVATVWRVVAHGVEGAILVVVGDVLQHGCIPDETKMAILHLDNGKANKKWTYGLGDGIPPSLTFCCFSTSFFRTEMQL